MSDCMPAWHDIPSGIKHAFALPVVPRPGGSYVELPALIVRGEKSGKTLVATAGVHGDEFEGILAIQRLYEALDPASMHGTFVGLPVANPPAFEAGLRTNPDDRQDMARIFPGCASGTVTEQIAHALTHRVLRHADLYCDLHSAGQYYAMPALTGYQLRPEPLLSIQRAAAKIFGLPLVWGTPVLPGRSLSSAGDHGVPAIYAEITGEGRCRAEDVDRYMLGLHRLLGYMKINGETVRATEPTWFIEDDRGGAGILQVQNRAPCGGLFQPAVQVWQKVERGQRLGLISNSFGNFLSEVLAPQAGRIVFLRTFPRVHAGDPVCTVLETDS